jgi:hypothetical protein
LPNRLTSFMYGNGTNQLLVTSASGLAYLTWTHDLLEFRSLLVRSYWITYRPAYQCLQFFVSCSALMFRKMCILQVNFFWGCVWSIISLVEIMQDRIKSEIKNIMCKILNASQTNVTTISQRLLRLDDQNLYSTLESWGNLATPATVRSSIRCQTVVACCISSEVSHLLRHRALIAGWRCFCRFLTEILLKIIGPQQMHSDFLHNIYSDIQEVYEY